MTFADKLAALREAATPGPWKDRSGEDVEPDLIVCRGTDAAFACYLVNHAADIEALARAADDALHGWRYIRETHGDLYGVGWDRVENSLTEALAALEGK